jgi:hypothetical protein
MIKVNKKHQSLTNAGKKMLSDFRKQEKVHFVVHSEMFTYYVTPLELSNMIDSMDVELINNWFRLKNNLDNRVDYKDVTEIPVTFI